MDQRLIFGALQHMAPAGMTTGSWRHPENQASNYLDAGHWIELGKKLENAGFDFLFLADSLTYPLRNGVPSHTGLRDAIQFPFADPMVMAPAVAAATERLGIAVTFSTMSERPAVLARRMATFDHSTNGRVGWNIVTGAAQTVFARLLGEEPTKHDLRYAMAEDFTELTLKLWETSWDDDALVGDKVGGVFADPAGVHEISHDGSFFRCHGLLTVPPSPQRTPFLFQAGTSAAGKRFAAKYAEGVFVTGGNRSKTANDIREIRRIAQDEYGRDPQDIKFLAGAMFVADETDSGAQRKRDEMLALASLESSAEEYLFYTGLDLMSFDLDKPLPPSISEEGQTSVDRYVQMENPPTVREIIESFRRDGVNGLTFTGSPTAIGNAVEEFVDETGVDGFLLEPYLTPGTYDDFINLVIPELTARGRFANDTRILSLRERVGGKGPRLPFGHPGAGLGTQAQATNREKP